MKNVYFSFRSFSFLSCVCDRCVTTLESTAPDSEPAALEKAGRGVVLAPVASVGLAVVMLAWSALLAPPLAPQHPTL